MSVVVQAGRSSIYPTISFGDIVKPSVEGVFENNRTLETPVLYFEQPTVLRIFHQILDGAQPVQNLVDRVPRTQLTNSV